MTHRAKLLGATFSVMALAAVVAAMAVTAASGGRVIAPPQVSVPSALPAQGDATVSAVRDGGAAPAHVMAELAALGAPTARLAREVDGRKIYLGRTSAGLTCMSVAGPQGRVTSTCQDAASITRGMLWVSVGGADEQSSRFFVVVPDHVPHVLLTPQAGQPERVTVTNNVAAHDGGQVARIEWSGTNSRAELQLP